MGAFLDTFTDHMRDKIFQGVLGPLEKDRVPAPGLAVPPPTPGLDSCSTQPCPGVQGSTASGKKQRVYLQLEGELVGPHQSTARFYVQRCHLPLSV